MGPEASTRVRFATASDLPSLVQMRLTLLAEEGKSSMFAPAHADAANVTEQLTSKQIGVLNAPIFVAERDGKLVGMLRCSLTRNSPLLDAAPFCTLTMAYVDAPNRRAGILRALVDAAERWSFERGVNDIRLRCTVENTEGNAAWAALGYGVAAFVRRKQVMVCPS